MAVKYKITKTMKRKDNDAKNTLYSDAKIHLTKNGVEVKKSKGVKSNKKA